MKNKVFRLVVRSIVMLALAAGTGALAQTPKHTTEFSGTLNDYTPATAPTTVKGPWEVRGHWSLIVNPRSGKANFSAELTMERSDLGVMANGVPTSTDPNLLNNPANRNAHTHNITIVNAEVTEIPGGFEVTGPATITINGAFPAPFQPAGTPSPTLTIDITGATGSEGDVTFSNVAVTFGDVATSHFGGNPLHGVVQVARDLDELRFRY